MKHFSEGAEFWIYLFIFYSNKATIKQDLKFFTVELLRIEDVWDVMLCQLCGYQHFGGTECFHC